MSLTSAAIVKIPTKNPHRPLDSALDGHVVESADVAESIDVVFRALQLEALTGSASLTKIEEAAQRWKEQITP
jgi:hypothetical protein